MREPRASYICNFDAKNSALSNYRGRVLDEISIKSGGWLGPTPNAGSRDLDEISIKSGGWLGPTPNAGSE